MALRAVGTWVWTGTTDTVYSKHTNWTIDGGAPDADDYPGWDNSEGGGSNVDGDTVILTGPVTNGCATAAGFDAGSKGELAQFIVTDTYDQDIGKSGGVLEIAMAGDGTGEVLIQGSYCGNVYLAGDATNYIGTITVLDLQSGKVIYPTGKLANLNLLKGQVTTADTTTIATSINVGYMTSPSSDATLVLAAGTTVPASINAQGGVVTNSVEFTSVIVGKARWTQADADITGALTQYGGTFKWNAGDITLAHIYDGTFDCTDGTEARTCDLLNQYGLATVDTNDGRRWVTITAWNLMTEQPKIKVVPGQAIAIIGA